MVRGGMLGRGARVGLVLASASIPHTLAPSLSRRSWIDQGVITGASASGHLLLSVVAQDLLEAFSEAVAPRLPGLPRTWSASTQARATSFAADAIIVPVGFGIARSLAPEANETATRGLTRQVAWRFAITGVGACLYSVSDAGADALERRLGIQQGRHALPLAVCTGLAASLAVERLRQRGGHRASATSVSRANPLPGLAAAAGMAALVVGATFGEAAVTSQLGVMGARALPGSASLWRRTAHLASLGGLAVGARLLWSAAMRRLEEGASTYEPGMDDAGARLWTGPSVSGGHDSLLSWQGLGREGRRHVTTFARPTPRRADQSEFQGLAIPDLSIQTVMGEAPKADPISIYVGLDHAASPGERVELAIAEMDRTDAWSRSLIMLVSPTGTGYVNYVAIASAQYLTRGDIDLSTLSRTASVR